MGPGLPGQRSVLAEHDRAFVEDRWGLPPGTIRRDFSQGAVDMFERLATGEIKACWIICTNPVVTMPNRKTTIAGLEAAELVITQDTFRDTATNRYADIVLPSTLWAESDSVMVNSDRNLTLLQQSIPAPGQTRPDWLLICQLAAELGFGDALQLLLQLGRVRRDPSVLQSRNGIRPAGRELFAATRDAAAVAGATRRRFRPSSDPLPQRRGQPGAVRRRERAPTEAGVSDAVAPSGVSPASRIWTPTSCPTTTTRSSSTPVGCNTNGTP